MANLFVGRLSKSSRQRDIEDIFSAYGRLARCDVKYGTGMAYAFVDYYNRRDAEDAMKYENDREIDGQRIVVEFSRGPKRSFQSSDDQCYSCGRRGHFARDCRDGGRGYSGGSRSGGRSGYSSRDRGSKRYSRSRSRSRSRDRKRSRSRSKDRRRSRSTDRSKSRSRSPEKKSPSKSPRNSRSKSREKSREKSRSKSREKSRSKSRSKSRERSASKERNDDNNEGNASPAKETGSPANPSQQTESSEGVNGTEESAT